MEAYDVSHTGGADSVGAMAVFTDFVPAKRDYRRFKIRGDEKGDDYAAIQETLYRRLNRAAAGDKSFLPLPDLILIDGGKGHVAAARQVIDALRVSVAAQGASAAASGGKAGGPGDLAARLGDVRVAGMVKDDKHRTRALVVPHGSAAQGADEPPGGKDPNAAGTSGPGEYEEIDLKGRPELFHLLGRIQEEVHRFVVEYHQKRRRRAMTE
jgi:excinuclease ABC subunit C